MPRIDYRLKDGTRVPGVTSIIPKEPGGLMHWAWKLGTEGKDYRKVRDEAADAGTVCHRWIETFVKDGREPEIDAEGIVAEKALGGYLSFREWWDLAQIMPLKIEPNLVSETLRYGGTPDLIGERNGEVILCDWKTGNVYDEVILQVAAYRNLIAENFGMWCARAHVLRVAKESASFAHHSLDVSVIDLGWKAFQSALDYYWAMKSLKGTI